MHVNDPVESHADARVLLHSVTSSADMAMIAAWQHQAQDALQLPAVISSIIPKAAQANIIPAAVPLNSWSAEHVPITGNNTMRY